jgi:SNF2 family DNA or RNA helicase
MRLVWPAEIAKWKHTTWLPWTILHGPGKENRLWGKHKAIYLINYEGLLWLKEELRNIPPEEWPFDMVVWDELSKMKSCSAQRFKAWKTLITKFRRRVGLTGSPAPNSLRDLWGQTFVIDGGFRFGTSYERFTNRWFEREEEHNRFKYKPRPKTKKQFHKRLKDMALRMGRDEYLDLIPAVHNDIIIELPPKAQRQYDELEAKMFVELDEGEVEAFSAATLMGKCLQFSGGGVYTDTKTREWELVHHAKMEALEDIIEEANGSPVIVAYGYKHEAERILKKYPQAVHMKSGLSMKRELAIQEAWDAGDIPILVLHPASAAHGLNLQYGGHILVWFTLTFSFEQYDQLRQRIDRSGQVETPIFHRLLVSGTVDFVAMTAVAGKEHTQSELLQAVRSYQVHKLAA